MNQTTTTQTPTTQTTIATDRDPYAGMPASAIAADMIRDVVELRWLMTVWAIRLEIEAARQRNAE